MENYCYLFFHCWLLWDRYPYPDVLILKITFKCTLLYRAALPGILCLAWSYSSADFLSYFFLIPAFLPKTGMKHIHV